MLALYEGGGILAEPWMLCRAEHFRYSVLRGLAYDPNYVPDFMPALVAAAFHMHEYDDLYDKFREIDEVLGPSQEHQQQLDLMLRFVCDKEEAELTASGMSLRDVVYLTSAATAVLMRAREQGWEQEQRVMQQIEGMLAVKPIGEWKQCLHQMSGLPLPLPLPPTLSPTASPTASSTSPTPAAAAAMSSMPTTASEGGPSPTHTALSTGTGAGAVSTSEEERHKNLPEYKKGAPEPEPASETAASIAAPQLVSQKEDKQTEVSQIDSSPDADDASATKSAAAPTAPEIILKPAASPSPSPSPSQQAQEQTQEQTQEQIHRPSASPFEPLADNAFEFTPTVAQPPVSTPEADNASSGSYSYHSCGAKLHITPSSRNSWSSWSSKSSKRAGEPQSPRSLYLKRRMELLWRPLRRHSPTYPQSPRSAAWTDCPALTPPQLLQIVMQIPMRRRRMSLPLLPV